MDSALTKLEATDKLDVSFQVAVYMEQIHVTLPDGSVKDVPKGTTPAEIARSISPRLADAALVARVAAPND
ncbi:MAG TPA: TGS domain-containing protein, partial [Candidatus Acidoferrum sp.]